MFDNSKNLLLLTLIVIVALAVFVVILNLNVPGTWKFVLALIEMLAVNQIFIKKYNLSSELGLILLKSQKGLDLIDDLAKNQIFVFLADCGTTISYGLLGFVLMRKNFSWKSFILGFVILLVLSFVVAPVALVVLSTTIKGVSFDQTASSAASSSTSNYVLAILSTIVLVAGGLFLFMLFGLGSYGLTIINAIIKTLTTAPDTLSHTAAGGSLLLPGVNLPFLEGIFALAIAVIVHESAHAILARVAKVPVLSSGIVLFGIIPMGAFVEPDEAKLKKTEQTKQTRIIVAGPTANFITSIIFFLLFLSFFYTTSSFREQGLLVLSGMESGTVIYQVNGEVPPIENGIAHINLPSSGDVTLSTNKGEIVRTLNSDGKLGIVYRPITKDSLSAVYSNQILQFIFVALGLTFALNFIVGSVNLLPVPVFDGSRLLGINLKNDFLLQAVTYLTIFLFILNFVPLLFK